MTLYFSISLLIGLDDYDDDEVPPCLAIAQKYFDYNALHAIPLIMHNAKGKRIQIFWGASTRPNLPNLKKTTDATIPIARVVFEGQ